jgi:uncharacterized protein YciI
LPGTIPTQPLEAAAMSFLIVNALTPECTDEKRLSVRDEHLAYGKRNRDLIRLSSRTFSTDGETLTGGFFVLRTDDYAQAKKFYENDPYVIHNIWSSVNFSSVQLPEETAS